MPTRPLPHIMVLLAALALPAAAVAITLQEAWEAAPAANGYDRWVELETGVVYEGGLLIGATWDDDRQEFRDDEIGLDTRIVGHGAILDLAGQQICISFCRNRLDIDDCIVRDGNVRFRGDRRPDVVRQPTGSVRYCTFYRPQDYAVRLQGAGEDVTVERNLVVDCVATGFDYVIWSGASGENLPTGVCFAPSVQPEYGVPVLRDNWTYFTDAALNDDPLHHFAFL